MSGGSLDYVYGKVRDAAESISERATTPLHRAFAAHLGLVADALHDLEWVWSFDYGKGDEEDAIRAVLHPGAELEAARKEAERAAQQLSEVLSRTLHSTPESEVEQAESEGVEGDGGPSCGGCGRPLGTAHCSYCEISVLPEKP